MNVVKFPAKNDATTIDDVARRFKSGQYLELYIVAIRSDRTLEKIDITRFPTDLNQVVAGAD